MTVALGWPLSAVRPSAVKDTVGFCPSVVVYWLAGTSWVVPPAVIVTDLTLPSLRALSSGSEMTK